MSLNVIYQFAENATGSLPLIQSLLLANQTSGRILSIMNRAMITTLGKNAVSSLVTDYLDRPEADEVAILGAGVQARYQLRIVPPDRKIKEARYFDLGKESAREFSGELSEELQIFVRPVKTARRALKSADIVCSANTSAVPILEVRYIKRGMNISTIDSWHPTYREISSDLIMGSFFFSNQERPCWRKQEIYLVKIKKGLISRLELWR
ncbi:MAG: hypothetical protein ACUVR0_04255 [Candidatus Aminicenantales bacterium]